MKSVIFFITFLFCSFSYANSDTYSCVIMGEYKISDTGKLIPDDQNVYIGQKFNVERKSGVVLGGGVGNSSYPTKTVIDNGGKDQAYKLIWISNEVIGTDDGRNAVYISIEEYNKGEIKPFSMIEGSKVLSGNCQ